MTREPPIAGVEVRVGKHRGRVVSGLTTGCALLLTGCGYFAAGAIIGLATIPGVGRTQTPPPAIEFIHIGTAAGDAAIDGRVPIRFRLFDVISRDVEVVVEVSDDRGDHFVQATGLALRDAGRVVGVDTAARLSASRAGEVHQFLWDTRADGMGGGKDLKRCSCDSRHPSGDGPGSHGRSRSSSAARPPSSPRPKSYPWDLGPVAS